MSSTGKGASLRWRVAWYAQVQRNHLFVFLCALRVAKRRALTESVTQLEHFVRGGNAARGMEP